MNKLEEILGIPVDTDREIYPIPYVRRPDKERQNQRFEEEIFRLHENKTIEILSEMIKATDKEILRLSKEIYTKAYQLYRIGERVLGKSGTTELQIRIEDWIHGKKKTQNGKFVATSIGISYDLIVPKDILESFKNELSLQLISSLNDIRSKCNESYLRSRVLSFIYRAKLLDKAVIYAPQNLDSKPGIIEFKSRYKSSYHLPSRLSDYPDPNMLINEYKKAGNFTYPDELYLAVMKKTRDYIYSNKLESSFRKIRTISNYILNDIDRPTSIPADTNLKVLDRCVKFYADQVIPSQKISPK